MTSCVECGADNTAATCDELFQRLLALDHSRQEPWGSRHAIAVACFFLQHPRHPSAPRDRSVAQSLLRTYVDEGLRAVTAWTQRARRANARQGSRGRQTIRVAGDERAGEAPTSYATTIVDVAEDGDFPAADYPAALDRWVAATVSPGNDADATS